LAVGAASSLGIDITTSFLPETKIFVEHVEHRTKLGVGDGR
jgi:hypothetical protein